MRDLFRGRVFFTHSLQARITNVVGKTLLFIALLVEVYMLFVTEWRAIARLPMDVALAAYGLTFLPAGSVAVTGVILMSAAHCTEYLARIWAVSETQS